jgi:3-methyladenine DNA glycosylase AlkC
LAEPLKNQFGPEVIDSIAAMISGVYREFDAPAFVAACTDGFHDLELTARARHIAGAMAEYLPDDRQRALEILTSSLGPKIEEADLKGMDVFRYLPYVFFVAEHGLAHFETAMRMQYEVTQRFTAEFSIRTYLEHHEIATLERLRTWTGDPSPHVRRLVSEGTRPRLPWAPRLRRFQEDPSPVIALLELLKDDPEEYVRRSVANNLNDIAKDHPDDVVAIARRWWPGGDRHRRRLIRRGLRTLIKQANPGALAVLGFDASSPVEVDAVRISPNHVSIGQTVRIEVDLANPSRAAGNALADLIVHFVKANGSTAPKVFKGGEFEIEGGGSATLRKSVSVKQHSTRTHYPGIHRVEVQLNGQTIEGGQFELTTAD